MGWTLDAYYPIDQKEVEEFIKNNNIDINDYNQRKIVKNHFYTKITKIECDKTYDASAMYYYNTTRKKHYLVDMHACNYIRDHKLLNSDDPDCPDLPFHVIMCLSVIRTPEDATLVANDLRKYLPDDEYLMYFADWLEHTSKYCYAYRLND